MLKCVPGKTELLYHLLCRCVLPVESGGLEVDVVFVDTDYGLDMLRLVSILDSRLSAGTDTKPENKAQIHVCYEHSSSRMSLFSSFQWLALGWCRRSSVAFVSVSSPRRPLLLVLPAPPHSPLPRDHLDITAKPGAPPR